MFGATFRQQRFDAQLPQPAAQGLAVITPITLHQLRALSRTTSLPLDWRDRLHQWLELGDIIDISRRHMRGQWDALRFTNHMMFAPGFGAINGIGPGWGPQNL